MKKIVHAIFLTGFLAISMASSTFGEIINVPADQATIQAAIDIANPGDEIIIASGSYSEILNIENKTNLTLSGITSARSSEISLTDIAPASAFPWAVGGYGSSRWAGIRIVGSSDISINDINFDFDIIKANTVTGVLIWDSEVTLTGCRFENISASDAAGQYTEIMTYVRAPSFTESVRALTTFDDCDFLETGRIGILAGDFVHLNVTSCNFEKTIPDFGYGMEIGSDATADISNCIITGYITPAASDGSASSGIYIENSFTTDITSALTKNVNLSHNFIHNNQWGIYIGNSFEGMTGDVDIVVALDLNLLFGNVKGAVVITDEGASVGSSVTLNSLSNNLVGNEDGYYLFTGGNGNLSVHLSRDSIDGHDIGYILYDNTPVTGSTYDLSLRNCHLIDSRTYGVFNVHGAAVIDARFNYWGSDSGPSGMGPGTGDAVSEMVDFFPWIGGDPTCCGEFSNGLTGNVDRNPDGRSNLADITLLIDRVYVSKTALECEADGNVDGDLGGALNLSDITRLIDVVYVSKNDAEACLPYTSSRFGNDAANGSEDRGATPAQPRVIPHLQPMR